MQTRIILVGGFLGAGKTTFIWRIAERLMARGMTVGLITNDQAPELVDSELLRRQHLAVSEVSGSCFCCNFNGFTDAVKRVAPAQIVLAEPVGSCADLSATILQPLKKYWDTAFLVSPLTVLADPQRLDAVLRGESAGLHEDAAYIFRKQLEEADIIVITKSDTLQSEQLQQLVSDTRKAFPASQVLTASAVAGEGLDTWLAEVTTRTEAGRRLLDIDYDRYAHGEAVLGWLNGTVALHDPVSTANWDALLTSFVSQLQEAFSREALPVGHVKIIAESGKDYAVANITGVNRTLTLREGVGESADVRLIINARVECAPEHLDQLVRDALLSAVDGRFQDEVLAWRYLQPGRPNPTHRFTEVV